jgi:hypothetical protein
MRNLLALFALVLLVFAVLGWFRDWYAIQRQPAAVDGHHSVNIDINSGKIFDDVKEGIQKIEEKKQQLTDKPPPAEKTENAPPKAPANANPPPPKP